MTLRCGYERLALWPRRLRMSLLVGAAALLLAACERESSSDARDTPPADAAPAQTTPAPSTGEPSAPSSKDPMARTMSRMPLKDTAVVADAQQAASVVDAQKTNLGLGQNDRLPITGNTADDRGNAYYQIQQIYKGIPVFGATGVLEVENGQAVAVSGSWVPDITLDTGPAITAERAVRRAATGADEGTTAGITFRTPAELVVFATADGLRLAWRGSVTVTDWAGKPFAGGVFVDAHDGTLLLKIPDQRPE
jgi:Zn-dependent metalloprotease